MALHHGLEQIQPPGKNAGLTKKKHHHAQMHAPKRSVLQYIRKAHGIDLLEDGAVRVVAGRGTKRMGPEFGVLQSLEAQGIRFVVILDGDDAGHMAAEAMRRFGARKNRHYFQLARVDYKDKGGKSWDVEIKEIKPRNLCALAVKRVST